MKNIYSYIFERLKLSNKPRHKEYKKLIDIKNGDKIYMFMCNRNCNFDIFSGEAHCKKLTEGNIIVFKGFSPGGNSIDMTFHQNTNYDNDSKIGAIHTEYLNYFIAADKDVFSKLTDKSFLKEILDQIYMVSIEMDIKLRKLLNENI